MFTFKRYITICTITVSSILIAYIFFSIQSGWLLWIGPINESHSIHYQQTSKLVNFFYWHYEQCKHETMHLIWTADEQENLHYLINSWLTFLHDEGYIKKKICINDTLINSSGTHLFISFDHKPFSKDQSTAQKVYFIKSLWATIAHASHNIKYIRVLVSHKPLHDPHLDFSTDWPIDIV